MTLARYSGRGHRCGPSSRTTSCVYQEALTPTLSRRTGRGRRASMTQKDRTIAETVRVRRAARAALADAGYGDVRLTLLRHRRYFVYRIDASRRRRFVLRVRDGDAISPAAATAQL